MLGMRTPTTGRRFDEAGVPAVLYPSSAAARLTLRTISSLTGPVPLRTRDAVASEQPAREATCPGAVIDCGPALWPFATGRATTYDEPGSSRNCRPQSLLAVAGTRPPRPR